MYNGYIYITTNKRYYEKNTKGLSYNSIGYYDETYKYSYLKRKRLHNLKYFTLVKKGNNIYNNEYKRNNVIPFAKYLNTGENNDILCIKIIDTNFTIFR